MAQPQRPGAALNGAAPEGAADTGIGLLGRPGALDARLVVLMGARLALAAVSLGIALAVDTTVGGVDEPGRRGLYATVALAFLATVLTGVALPRLRLTSRFAAANIIADIAIVSSLVHFSGGPDSLFGFLYVVVALYGTLLFERRGALISAGLGTASYGGVLLTAWARAPLLAHGVSPAVLIAVWGSHAVGMAAVAALAGTLVGELRQRTRALERLASLHQHTVESLMSGLLTTDETGRITSFNPEAQSITGLSARDALGRRAEDVLPGLDPLADSGRDRGRMSYHSADGRRLHLGVGTYALRTGGAAPDGRVVIFQDVTDVVAMEQELRRSERLAAVGELSASIAHEIRNPLAAISGSIQLLRRGAQAPEAPPDSDRLMGIVLRETERLNRLIGDFLHFARPGALRIESVDLAVLLADMREMLDSVLPDQVELTLEVPAELRVQADPGQLHQLLWNLILNSVQAMPDGGEVRVVAAVLEPVAPQASGDMGRNAENKEASVEICVRDTGEGISAEVLERIFDPFFTTKPEGSGLGLATVHRIVEEHGGSLKLESEERRGTTVRVRLPRGETSD